MRLEGVKDRGRVRDRVRVRGRVRARVRVRVRVRIRVRVRLRVVRLEGVWRGGRRDHGKVAPALGAGRGTPPR